MALYFTFCNCYFSRDYRYYLCGGFNTRSFCHISESIYYFYLEYFCDNGSARAFLPYRKCVAQIPPFTKRIIFYTDLHRRQNAGWHFLHSDFFHNFFHHYYVSLNIVSRPFGFISQKNLKIVLIKIMET